MNRDEIIARLRENEASLRQRGVAHAALFGSRARGDQHPESDTDIMIEFDPAARITVFDYAALKCFIANLFDGRVDVVNRDGLKPYVKSTWRSNSSRGLVSMPFGTIRAQSTPSRDVLRSSRKRHAACRVK